MRLWEGIAGNLVLTTELNRSDEGLMLETSASFTLQGG